MKKWIRASKDKRSATKSVDEIENDLWNMFYQNRDLVLAYDTNFSATGQNSYIDSYVIKYTDAGLRLYRQRIHRHADFEEENYLISAGFHEVAKSVMRIQSNLDRWERIKG